ncbi:MAG: glycerate kinase [Nitrososphaerota archaeon]
MRRGLIKNVDELLEGYSGPERKLREDLLSSAEKAIRAVQPDELLRKKFRLKGNTLMVGDLKVELTDFDEVVVLGAGKATHVMCRYVEQLLGHRITRGLIIVPHSVVNDYISPNVKIRGGGHPVPDKEGYEAAKELVEIAQSTGPKSLVLVLISGGGSALMPLPAEPVTLEDKVEITKALLKSGATIDEMNLVRKHLSMVKGGWLARHLSKARTISLILSDVVGDKLEVIASGPTSPDPTKYADAVLVLKKYGLWGSSPLSIKVRLERGMGGELPETPKPDDVAFSKVHNVIIGSCSDACNAAFSALTRLGYNTIYLTHRLKGEARYVGQTLAKFILDVKLGRTMGSTALVLGGETTVTVKGKGVGGRNQELALSAAIELEGSKGCACLSIGTDGLDGPTDAAGAITDCWTLNKGRNAEYEARAFLEDNDSYTFLKRVSCLIFTGPTGTNVGDLVLLGRFKRP